MDAQYTPPKPKSKKKEKPFKLDFRYLITKFFFPNLKNRGKREYAGILVRRASTYLALSYGLSITFGILLFYLDDLSIMYGFIWNPEEILYVPFVFTFLAETPELLVTSFIMTIFLPYFIAGTICAMFWKDEARDLVLISSIVSFLLFVMIHLSQILLFSSVAASISGLFAGFYYIAYIFVFSLSFLIISAIGGSVGVRLGKILTSFLFSKRGAKVSYSHLLLPEMPLSVKTIFDLDKPPKRQSRQTSAISYVYLNKKVQKLLRTTKRKHCTYFTEGKCAYLGYATAVHKYQICVTDYWPLCRVYAFLNQSKIIVDKVGRGANED
jgi:hypothetical protein